MTTSDTANKFRYLGNGVTDTFAFSGRIFTTADIKIDIITRATDVLVETLTLSTDYSVTINGDESASVTVTNGAKIPSSSQDILLRRDLAKTQTVDLPTGTVFPAKAVENALDRMTALVQDQSEVNDRTVQIPITSDDAPPTIGSLSADEIVSVSSDGSQLETTGVSATTLSSVAANAAAAASSAGAASTSETNAAASAVAAQAAVGGVKVSGNDTTPGDLEGKLLVGAGLSLSTQNDGGNETRTIDLDISSLYQPLDTDLTALAGLTSAANKLPYFTGSETAGLLDFLDEDTMSSNSATALASQQSVKAYVDNEISGISMSGALIDVQVFTSSGTWTKPAGTNAAEVSVVGGGGGGGGQTGNAGTGGTSSLGSHCSATGGGGGTRIGITGSAGQGGIGSNGDQNVQGGAGQTGWGTKAPNSGAFSGSGGSSILGGGAQGHVSSGSSSTNGTSGGNYGGGGSGMCKGSSGEAGCGGGGGGASMKYITSGLGATETVTVGAGGSSLSSGGAGSTGIVIVKAYT